MLEVLLQEVAELLLGEGEHQRMMAVAVLQLQEAVKMEEGWQEGTEEGRQEGMEEAMVAEVKQLEEVKRVEAREGKGVGQKEETEEAEKLLFGEAGRWRKNWRVERWKQKVAMQEKEENHLEKPLAFS